ncbi:MAG: type I-F CRISPR-associated protein Csy2 [Porticoccaceae bacterium]|nr:type I-F CRISPR-associated protein Csy2 [Porticoccaceae bacterium]
MPECPYFEHVLVIPRLRVQNANAISSPLTHGFPAISAFVGLMWNLERQTRAAGLDMQFNAVGVVAHDIDEQVTDSRYVSAFRLTRNPVGKDGKTAAIVEEGRMHLDISLVFAVQSQQLQDDVQAPSVVQKVAELMANMRIAGGSVLPSTTARARPYFMPLSTDGDARERLFRQLKMRLLPGFALVERQDLLDERLQSLREKDESSTSLDAWLSLSRFNWRWQPETDDASKGSWQHDRKGAGWLVPIPVGYAGLSELHPAGSVSNARDAATDFRFVESVYGMGQWLGPHRLQEAQQLFWYADYQAESGLYRYRNDYISAISTTME